MTTASRHDVMLTGVALKTLRDQRRSLTGWTVSLALLVAMYVAIWPSMRDQPGMAQFLDQMPEGFRALFAMSGADLSTPVGYVKVELLSFLGPIVVLLYAITTAGGAIAGEEDRRTLDLLLTLPVSRTRVVLEKAAAMVVGTLFLGGVLTVALLLEGMVVGMDLPAGRVLAAMTHLALLGMVFGALALALGAGTGRPGASKAIPAAVAVLAYVVNGLGGVVSWLEPLRPLSPFYQYAGHDPLLNGFSWPAAGVAGGTTVVLVAIAVVAFRGRDVRG